MENITLVGVDLAKNVFQVHAEDQEGKKLMNRRFTRAKFREFMAELPPCRVGMEACGTAHYWGRELSSMKHDVKLINPRKVKALVERNKNDAKDAEAVCDCTRSHKVRGIPVKTLEQQDLVLLHRARTQLVKRRTQLTNHLRSQLAEYGLVTRQGYASLAKLTGDVLAGKSMDMNEVRQFVIEDLREEWLELDKRLKKYNERICCVAKKNATVRHLLTMPGIGEITATALFAKVADFKEFNKGRDFAAWLGLTPKEYSSAHTRRLGGISKQGDRHLRTLLIHGARSVLNMTIKKDRQDTAYHRWIHSLLGRMDKNKVVVALANKHARMLWALMTHGTVLDLNHSETFAESV